MTRNRTDRLVADGGWGATEQPRLPCPYCLWWRTIETEPVFGDSDIEACMDRCEQAGRERVADGFVEASELLRGMGNDD